MNVPSAGYRFNWSAEWKIDIFKLRPPLIFKWYGQARLANWLRKRSPYKTSAQFLISSLGQILYALENHIGGFMDIFIYDQDVLRKVDVLMDCSLVSPRMKGGLKWSGLAPPGYHEIVLFKCLLIGQWHGLSGSKLEESLRVRFNDLPFAALDLHCTVRGETTHYRFRSDTAWSCHA